MAIPVTVHAYMALVLGVAYGIPAYLGACAVRALLRPVWR
jgi:hypothetical protein